MGGGDGGSFIEQTNGNREIKGKAWAGVGLEAGRVRDRGTETKVLCVSHYDKMSAEMEEEIVLSASKASAENG